MAKQSVGIGSSANDGQGDTLRTGATKINDNFNEIYAEFGDGTNLSSGNTAGDILVADGTKFANVTTSGDINISNSGAINLRGNELSVAQGSTPSSTTNKLYNVGGTLYWNGSTIGVASGGSFSSFTVAGGSGTSQSIQDGNTLTIAGTSGQIKTVASDTDTITVSLDLTTGLTFEGATANDFETTLAVTDPTADRTITLPDATGTVALTSDITVTASSTTEFTNKTLTSAVLNTGVSGSAILDSDTMSGASATTLSSSESIKAYVDSNALSLIDEDDMSTNSATRPPSQQSVKAYVDANAGGTITVQDEGSALSTGATTLNFVGAGVTASGNAATKTITIAGGGASNLNGLSDATVSSADGGQVLLHDDSDSFDNKYVKVFENNSAYTTALPMFFGAQMFTISAAATDVGYTFENYNSNGTDQNNGGTSGDPGPTLTIFEDQIVVFHLKWGSGHPFAIRTGASGGSNGTNLATNNGGDNLIHIATNGTVTTGTSANAQTSGYLIWKVPHFGSNQASTYYYQCTSHAANMYGLIKIRTITY